MAHIGRSMSQNKLGALKNWLVRNAVLCFIQVEFVSSILTEPLLDKFTGPTRTEIDVPLVQFTILHRRRGLLSLSTVFVYSGFRAHH